MYEGTEDGGRGKAGVGKEPVVFGGDGEGDQLIGYFVQRNAFLFTVDRAVIHINQIPAQVPDRDQGISGSHAVQRVDVGKPQNGPDKPQPDHPEDSDRGGCRKTDTAVHFCPSGIFSTLMTVRIPSRT